MGTSSEQICPELADFWNTLQIPQNLLRKIFLIWEISEYFSQNKKNKLAEKNFLVASAR